EPCAPRWLLQCAVDCLPSRVQRCGRLLGHATGQRAVDAGFDIPLGGIEGVEQASQQPLSVLGLYTGSACALSPFVGQARTREPVPSAGPVGQGLQSLIRILTTDLDGCAFQVEGCALEGLRARIHRVLRVALEAFVCDPEPLEGLSNVVMQLVAVGWVQRD